MSKLWVTAYFFSDARFTKNFSFLIFNVYKAEDLSRNAAEQYEIMKDENTVNINPNF